MKFPVLSSVRSPGPETNPFILLLEESLENEISVQYFSWFRAFFSGYKVLHVHWPENLYRSHGLLAVVKPVLAWLFVLKLTVFRIPILWTVHNNSPHEQSPWHERLFLTALTSRVSQHVYFSCAQARVGSDAGLVIPHGNYIIDPKVSSLAQRQRGRITVAGLLRPYKGLEDLVSAFSGVRDHQATLRIVGKPQSVDYEREVSLLASSWPQISFLPKYLSDAELQEEICNAEIVVLPYKNFVNSGMALLALGCRRPVLVPRTPTSEELAGLVGPWVMLFSPPLIPEHIEAALEDARGLEGHPNLEAFNWVRIGQQYSEVFRRLAGR